jgi:predicted membrane protein
MPIFSHDTTGLGLTPRLLLGLALALFGIVLLLGELDILDARSVLRFWPLILVAIGLLQFLNPRAGAPDDRGLPMSGVVWMAIGGILLLNSFDILRVSIWELFWPVILIVVGVRLMTRPRRRGGGRGAGTTDAGTSGDIGPIFAVLSGVKRVSAPEPFQGAEVTTFMGGAHVDLRQAILRSGDEAVLDVFAVMGGCDLLIPAHWVVSAPIVALMGGVDDKRVAPPPTVIADATASAAASPRLVIRGFVMMGSVTIRS